VEELYTSKFCLKIDVERKETRLSWAVKVWEQLAGQTPVLSRANPLASEEMRGFPPITPSVEKGLKVQGYQLRKKHFCGQAWWYIFVIPVPRRLRQKDWKFKGNPELAKIGRPYFKKIKQKQTNNSSDPGNLVFQIQEHTDLGIEHDPHIGIWDPGF
jgi:ribosomal protein L5